MTIKSTIAELIQAGDETALANRATELREPSGGVPVRVATCQDSEGNGFELRQQP
ncbi:MAG: hypothetical protein ACI8V2_002964 [Candidatus Latescibacterota bacterium]|jgi:hypothetical protein